MGASAVLPALPPGWRQRFAIAVQAAFPSWEAMTRLLYLGMDESLDAHASKGPMTDVIVAVLRWAEADGRLGELATCACRQAPDNRVLHDVAAEAGWAPGAEATTQEAVAAVQTGLRALRELLSPSVREALAGFRATFESADRRLQRVAGYKALHDRLHDFQFRCYAPIASIARTFPLGDTRAQLRLDCLTLRTELQKIREIAARATFEGDDFAWIEDNLSPAEALLAGVQDEKGVPALQQAVRLMSDVVQLQPTVVNTLLIRAVEDLDLSALVKSLTGVTAELAKLKVEGELPMWVEKAGWDLQILHTSLAEQMASHRAWQRVDNSLRMFEATLSRTSVEIQPAWAIVDKAAQRVLNGTEAWVTELRDVAALVSGAVADPSGANVFLFFSRFQSLASTRFWQVDKDLKQLCDRLTPIGQDLEGVVEGLES